MCNKKNKLKVLIVSISLLLIPALMISCGNKNNNKGNGKPSAGSYKVLQLTPNNVTTHIDFPATIQGQQDIEIRPKIDGYIENIYVNEGATVKKGQLLIKISNPQYDEDVRTAEASIKIAEADVLAAQMNVNKVKPLVEKDIISKYELQSAEYTLQSKEAILAQSKASLANARTNLGYTSVRSPLDGVIGNIPYKIGALVSSSTVEPLTTLSDISKVHVYFSMNEKQLLSWSSISPGVALQEILNRMLKPVLMLADGSEYPERGKLETASGIIATETGTVSLKAVFSNAKGLLRSGASALIRLPIAVDSAVLVPQSATYEVLDKRFVFAVGINNKVYSVAIGSLPTDDGQFFIVSDGLKNGDKIVLSGITGLKDSTEIKPELVRADSIYARIRLAE